MSQITDHNCIEELAKRLIELRKRQSLSQKDLSEKTKRNKSSGVTAQQIWRIETRKHKAVRTLTVEILASSLGVTSEILTGQAPLPEPEPIRADRPSDKDYQINVPVDGAVRNAFTLTAMRYRVPITRIVELAPFLFLLAAEASLERRRDIAKNLQEAFDHARDLVKSRPYHDIALSPPGFDALASEKQSISTRDILGDTLSGEPIEQDYDESQHNPFVTYLKDAAPSDASIASIRRFDRASVEFNVCDEDALKLTGGDKEFADSIIGGQVILHPILRELGSDSSAEALIGKLREEREEYQQRLATLRLVLGL